MMTTDNQFVVDDPHLRDALFQRAMIKGVLSFDDVLNGVYMYMHSDDRRDSFKHRETKQYVHCLR